MANAALSMDLKLHATNKQKNPALSGDLGSLLFEHAGHAWSHPANITWFN